MTEPTIRPEQALALERVVEAGGVAVFPADTVYGVACDPSKVAAVDRLYALKGRPPAKPAAVLLFRVDAALAALPELGERTRAAVEELLPGPVTLLLANPERRWPLACGPDPGTLGLRVPALPPALQALEGIRVAVLQSSANRAGEPEARRLEDVPESIRDGADLVLDGGDLPGVASTVIDLRGFEADGAWAVVRAGALPADRVADALNID